MLVTGCDSGMKLGLISLAVLQANDMPRTVAIQEHWLYEIVRDLTQSSLQVSYSLWNSRKTVAF